MFIYNDMHIPVQTVCVNRKTDTGWYRCEQYTGKYKYAHEVMTSITQTVTHIISKPLQLVVASYYAKPPDTYSNTYDYWSDYFQILQTISFNINMCC